MVKLEGEDWVMNSSQLVMVRDNAEVNLSELSVAKLNLSECGLVGGGDSCKLCTTIDYWVEGPVILVVCLAGILGHHTYNWFNQNTVRQAAPCQKYSYLIIRVFKIASFYLYELNSAGTKHCKINQIG